MGLTRIHSKYSLASILGHPARSFLWTQASVTIKLPPMEMEPSTHHITPVRFEGNTYVATYTIGLGTVTVTLIRGPGFYWVTGDYGVADTAVGDSESAAQELAKSILSVAKERGDL